MTFLRHPITIAFIGAVLFGSSLSLRVGLASSDTPPVKTEEVRGPSLKERSEARALQDLFKGLPLEGKAIAVWDGTEGRPLFEKNAGVQLPLASLTKVMLAYVGNSVLDDNDSVTVTTADLSEEGSSGISPGERFRYADLRAATLVASLNDGANAISRSIGEVVQKEDRSPRQKYSAVALMNSAAQDLGLLQTYFYNEDGLDLGEGQPGAVGSAEDMARLFSALAVRYPETLFPTTNEGYELRSRFGNTYQYWNTNQRLAEIPNMVGSKTGYTTLADGNLAVAFFHEGHMLVVVILGSSKEGRFSDMKKVVDFLNSHSLPKLSQAGDVLESLL